MKSTTDTTWNALEHQSQRRRSAAELELQMVMEAEQRQYLDKVIHVQSMARSMLARRQQRLDG